MPPELDRALMLRIGIFLVVSVGLLAFSWRSLRNPRSHGFFRFFAFEFLLVLILLNSRFWFSAPFAPHQLLSWVLLSISLVLAVHGFMLLRSIGRPSAGIETTTVLVVQGAFRYIRHPLYASLLLLTWGAALKRFSWSSGLAALAASVSLYLTARAEEQENLHRFGPSYAAYMQKTRRFIPFLF